MIKSSSYNVEFLLTEKAVLVDEVKRLRAWLQYIVDSDSSVVPKGFHECMAEKALSGDRLEKVTHLPWGAQASEGTVR